MFPQTAASPFPFACLPRLGGGVSWAPKKKSRFQRSSPPRRGCFHIAWPTGENAPVFPASAGVFPAAAFRTCGRQSLPRLGGGVSHARLLRLAPPASSPPRRGCFLETSMNAVKTRVFPASAGVFLQVRSWPPRSKSLPRLGGGVSSSENCIAPTLLSSPPRRGCFPLKNLRDSSDYVFPASAGVFLKRDERGRIGHSLPRLGGGVSSNVRTAGTPEWSSPPRRGCFPFDRYANPQVLVFPASAGVFPARMSSMWSVIGLPRLGGGVSLAVFIATASG